MKDDERLVSLKMNIFNVPLRAQEYSFCCCLLNLRNAK